MEQLERDSGRSLWGRPADSSQKDIRWHRFTDIRCGPGGEALREKVFVVVAITAWGELLRDRIERTDGFEVVGIAADGGGALPQLELLDPPPDIVLLDVGAHLALKTARALRARDAAVRLVAIGLEEHPAQVLPWAMVGATGLVARTASVDELLSTLIGVARGEAPCSSGMTGALLRGVGTSSNVMLDERSSTELTSREREVARLVADGHSNKEIAAHLQIQPGTVKCHVHIIIRKLGVSRRTQVAAKLWRDNLGAEWPESLSPVAPARSGRTAVRMRASRAPRDG